jgi:hypothetical protein
LIYLVVKEAMAIARKQNGRQKSGELDPAQWREVINEIVEKQVNRVLEAIRDARNQRSP